MTAAERPGWLARLGRRRAEREAARSLYAALVAQARDPTFYRELGVPDSLDGRFDMILLHAVLLVRRLRECAAPGRRVAQAFFDTMMDDMDRSLREMGVGDLAVGRRVKAMARAFYGRAAAYDAALGDGGEAALAAALARNVWADATPGDAPPLALASYVRASERALSGQACEALVAGSVRFPAPGRGSR